MTSLAEIELPRGTVELRAARRADVPAIVALLAADQLGATRDGVRDEADLGAYEEAFAAIDADPAHILLVASTAGGSGGRPPVASTAGGSGGRPPVASTAGGSGGRPPVASTAGEIVGTMQLSFLPGLARRGALRAQIEAVRVAESTRGSGLGAAMMRWAIEESRRRGCALVQLTSDKSRADAHRFYERLGFVASHEGMKLKLEP
jgi:ribosomal protein S18 acetylase RimI-like enzyme